MTQSAGDLVCVNFNSTPMWSCNGEKLFILSKRDNMFLSLNINQDF